jgi:hypothetical protein
MQSIAASLVENLDSKAVQAKIGINLKFLSFELLVKSTSKPEIPRVTNMEQALNVIFDIREIHSEKPIIVINEFDAIQDAEELFKFAEFLKKWAARASTFPSFSAVLHRRCTTSSVVINPAFVSYFLYSFHPFLGTRVGISWWKRSKPYAFCQRQGSAIPI